MRNLLIPSVYTKKGLGVIVQQNSGAKIEYMVFTVYSTTY